MVCAWALKTLNVAQDAATVFTMRTRRVMEALKVIFSLVERIFIG
jgi:hypothetical protein